MDSSTDFFWYFIASYDDKQEFNTIKTTRNEKMSRNMLQVNNARCFSKDTRSRCPTVAPQKNKPRKSPFAAARSVTLYSALTVRRLTDNVDALVCEQVQVVELDFLQRSRRISRLHVRNKKNKIKNNNERNSDQFNRDTLTDLIWGSKKSLEYIIILFLPRHHSVWLKKGGTLTHLRPSSSTFQPLNSTITNDITIAWAIQRYLKMPWADCG